jgi:sporulation protein YlmC with PRC-barrel domain
VREGNEAGARRDTNYEILYGAPAESPIRGRQYASEATAEANLRAQFRPTMHAAFSWWPADALESEPRRHRHDQGPRADLSGSTSTLGWFAAVPMTLALDYLSCRPFLEAPTLSCPSAGNKRLLKWVALRESGGISASPAAFHRATTPIHRRPDMKRLASAAALLLFVSGGAYAQPTSETPKTAPTAPEATQPAPPPAPEATQPAPAPEAAQPEAQPAPPAPEAAQPMPSAPTGAEKMTAVPGDSVTVTDYYKQNVYDASDNTIGEISDVLLDKDGHVTAVMLSVGGFLGLGAKYVGVPFNALRTTEKDGKRYLVMDTTKDALTSAPGYQYDKTKGQWVPETK